MTNTTIFLSVRNAYRSNCYSFCNSYPSLVGSAFVSRVHQPHYFQLLSSYGELLGPPRNRIEEPSYFQQFRLLFIIQWFEHVTPHRAANFRERDHGSHFLLCPMSKYVFVVNSLHHSFGRFRGLVLIVD